MSLLRTTLAEERHEPIPGGEPPRGVDMLERLVDRNMALRMFVLRFLHPEDLGYAVSPSVRDDARQVLGLPRVES